MADAMTLAKTPSEKIGDFNKRLKQACIEQPITDASICVVDGQPVVTIFSEMEEADEEDVQAAQDDGETLELGELIPKEDPIIAQVSRLECTSDDAAVKTQAFTERLYQRAASAVTEVLYASGSIFGFVEAPDKKMFWCEQSVNYILIAHVADTEEEDTTKEDERMKKTLLKGKGD